MRVPICLLLLALYAEGAAASGGISCAADDGTVALSVEGGVTRGMGGALFSFAGTVELGSDGIEADLRRTEFGRAHVAQYWFDDGTLKLRLYREREGDAPHGYVEVALDTALDEGEGEFRGDYAVTVYDMTHAVDSVAAPAEFSGAVACTVE
ncbi:MAG TPA: hypothetical protein PL183_05080 [Aquamicrobium sp.]|nr:hypothetical protein [Aquamicrobium sp.]